MPVTLVCHCGTPFDVDPYRARTAKSCSVQCADKIRRGPKTRPIEDRFFEKVCFYPGECWEWMGARDGGGYGMLKGLGKAHRVSWEIHNGPIPDGDGYHGTVVRHKCDNPGCVNPDHLELGTQADNVDDMIERGNAVWQNMEGNDE